jgi:hypothetical protein
MSSRFLRRWPVNRARKTALLCCALCVVPVIFVTQLDTRFIVNDDFFHRLDHAQIPGDTAGATVAVPAADAAALRALLNQNYTSAKQFSRGAATALGAVKTGPYLPAILRAAGRNPSAEALADQLQTALPPDLLTMLRSLRNRKFVTPMDIPPALNELAGRAEEARIEPALLTCARTDNWYWLAVFLLALAAGGHQAWAASVFAISSDIFPQKAIASVTGFGGMVGALGSLIADFVLGNLLTNSGPAGYFFAFLFASCIYLVCLGGMHLLMPRMTPLGEDLRPAPR